MTSELIFNKVNARQKVLVRKDGLMDLLKDEPVDVLMTLGAGDIDRFIGPVTRLLEDRLKEK